MANYGRNWTEGESERHDGVQRRKKPRNVNGTSNVATAPESAPVEFRVKGVVKFFDTPKGYGFIVPSEGANVNVFLHATPIKVAGFREIADGATVECMAAHTGRSPSVVRVLSVDLSTATGPVRPLMRESNWVAVRLKRATKDGLIFGTPDDKLDVLIPHSVIERSPLPREVFAEGQNVQVKYVDREKGRAAVAVR
jgi:cold shock CspA family protein